MKTLSRERDATELLRRLKNVRPETAARWGRMSAHQMVCHLNDALRMAMGEKPVSEASGLFHRTILKWFVLFAPLRWPAGIPTRPEIDQYMQGTRPVQFDADIAQFEALLALLTARTRNFVWPIHPIFGPMSEAEWLRWGYLHTDHHLRQFGA